MAIEVTNHNPSVIVDDIAWVEVHGWWFLVGSKELDVVNFARQGQLNNDVGICEDGAPVLLMG